MTVSYTDGDNSGEEVEVSSSVVIPQPLHVSLVHQQRTLVVGHYVGHQMLAADRTHSLVRRSLHVHTPSLLHRISTELKLTLCPLIQLILQYTSY